MNLFLEQHKIKIVEKLKTERIKTQMNNKNVLHLLGKKEKVVIQLYQEEIHFLCCLKCIVHQLILFPKQVFFKKTFPF